MPLVVNNRTSPFIVKNTEFCLGQKFFFEEFTLVGTRRHCIYKTVLYDLMSTMLYKHFKYTIMFLVYLQRTYFVRDSQLLPPFTRVWMNYFTLTFRALAEITLGQHQSLAIAMLCFNQTVGFPLSVPILSWLLIAYRIDLTITSEIIHAKPFAVRSRRTASHASPSAHAESSRFKSQPTDPTYRANPFPKVTDLFCQLPLATLFYQLEAAYL